MKYGVLLTHYKGQPLNMWVGLDGDGRFETSNLDAAQKVRDDYSNRNPGGDYSVQEIEEKKDV